MQLVKLGLSESHLVSLHLFQQFAVPTLNYLSNVYPEVFLTFWFLLIKIFKLRLCDGRYLTNMLNCVDVKNNFSLNYFPSCWTTHFCWIISALQVNSTQVAIVIVCKLSFQKLVSTEVRKSAICLVNNYLRQLQLQRWVHTKAFERILESRDKCVKVLMCCLLQLLLGPVMHNRWSLLVKLCIYCALHLEGFFESVGVKQRNALA